MLEQLTKFLAQRLTEKRRGCNTLLQLGYALPDGPKYPVARHSPQPRYNASLVSIGPLRCPAYMARCVVSEKQNLGHPGHRQKDSASK